jgi:hypothetical protein
VLDDYDVLPYDEAEIARLAALGLTPETDPTKNRLHLDVETPDRSAEVERLVALGATIQVVRERWTSMLDPEGNEFCVADLD